MKVNASKYIKTNNVINTVIVEIPYGFRACSSNCQHVKLVRQMFLANRLDIHINAAQNVLEMALNQTSSNFAKNSKITEGHLVSNASGGNASHSKWVLSLNNQGLHSQYHDNQT